MIRNLILATLQHRDGGALVISGGSGPDDRL